MSETDPEIQRCTEGDASLTLDLRHDPLVLLTWIGAPTLGMLDQLQAWYDDLYERKRERGASALVMISDATAAAMPTVAARHRVAELRHDLSILIKLIAVAPSSNPVLRGIVHAICWVIGDDRRFAVVSSFEHALEIAARAFEQQGSPIPERIDQLRAELRSRPIITPA